jgi:hypothetical protein
MYIPYSAARQRQNYALNNGAMLKIQYWHLEEAMQKQ